MLIFPQRVPILEKLPSHYQFPCEINCTGICAFQENQIALAKNVIINAVSEPPVLKIVMSYDIYLEVIHSISLQAVNNKN